MSARRIAALARYALATNLRTPYTWAAAGFLLAMAGLGLLSSARAGDGWVVDFPLLFDGGLLAAVFGLRSGLIAQRTGGLQTFLRANLVSPVEHMAGAMVSLLGAWLLLCAAVFAVTLPLPGGGLGNAAWIAAVFGLRIGILLPFVLVAESVTTIELPFVLPGVLFMALLLALALSIGEVRATTLLLPPVQVGSFASAVPALLRFVAVAPGGFGVVLAATRLRSRRAERGA